MKNNREIDYTMIRDKSIISVVKALNEAGLKTKYCCSGTNFEHEKRANGVRKNYSESGYISFEISANPTDKRNEILYYLAKSIGFGYERYYESRDGQTFALLVLRIKRPIAERTSMAMRTLKFDAGKLERISDDMKMLKWEQLGKAALIIKNKGLEYVNAIDFFSICNQRNGLKAKYLAEFYTRSFQSKVIKEIKKEHVIRIINYGKGHPYKVKGKFRRVNKEGKIEKDSKVIEKDVYEISF